MRGLAKIGFLTATLVVASCSNIERSRTLNNPDVSATVLAVQVCSNCHGVDGNSVSPNFPKLAGQQETYFIAQMTGFQSHGRSDPAGFEYMWGLSRSLTEAQIKGLAAYYAAQVPGKLRASAPQAQIDAGKAIFKTGVAAKEVPACTTCHGDQGQGNDKFPRIAGQHDDYIVKQLMVFQRTNQRPDGAVMKTVAHGLSQQNIEDVAAFLQTQ